METRSHALQQYEQRQADAATRGIANAAVTIAHIEDGLSAQAVLNAITEQAQRVNAGDLRDIEARLVASIATLDALFHRYIAKSEQAPSPRMQEMYAKMAFKAKGQAIRAAEALSGIKTGPLVIANQVNMANGPQQVNNSQPPEFHIVKNEGGQQNE
jgi:hypothetical protein